jgi:hypothetical protein
MTIWLFISLETPTTLPARIFVPRNLSSGHIIHINFEPLGAVSKHWKQARPVHKSRIFQGK